MRVPPTLEPLIEQGMITEVIRPLMSGKEAQVYLVASNGVPCVAKVYKEAAHRSFKHRADYTEGRKVRSSRTQRAMGRKSRFGKEQIEAAWRNAEVDAIHRLRDADVRVPEPYAFVDGVLLMELVTGDDGEPAPRLADVDLHPDDARDLFDIMLEEVTKMLCAGLVHGDLSDFNVLLGARGPVVIDFPQALDAAGNRNARNILIRDVENLHNFMARWSRGYQRRPYAEEMWTLYERGELLPDTRLRGLYRPDERRADVGGLLREIGDARRDAARAGLVRDARGAEDDAGRGDGARGARGFESGPTGAAGLARRRVEVVMERGGRDAAGGGLRGRGDARGPGRGETRGPGPGDARGPGRGAPGGPPGARGTHGEQSASAAGRNGAPQAQERGGRDRRRGRPLPDTQALLAAQPVVTDAQREKAAQIAEAARAAQAARAARSAQPQKGNRSARDAAPAQAARGAQAPKGSRPVRDTAPKHAARNGQPQKGHAARDAAPGHARAAAAGAGVASHGAPSHGAPRHGASSNDAPSGATQTEGPAKRRRRRRRGGRSGGATQEPSA